MMSHSRRFCIPLLLTLSTGLTANAHAQLYGPGTASLSSYATLAAGNLSVDGMGSIPEYPTAPQYSATGQPVSTTASISFTGMDSQGAMQTMTLAGTARASAEYGIFHAYASGQVLNPYYNAANLAYYQGGDHPNPAGSPQYLDIFGQTLFTDTLTLNPTIDPIVGLRYIFHIEGVTTDNSYAYLAFSVGDNSTTFFTSSNETTMTDWTTPEWNVTPGSPIVMSGNFGAVFGANTNFYTTTEGMDITGVANYSNTLLLSSIQLLDASGNQVNGATYLTASGAQYNIVGATYGPAATTPEPGSVALLIGLGVTGAGFLARRRKARSAA